MSYYANTDANGQAAGHQQQNYYVPTNGHRHGGAHPNVRDQQRQAAIREATIREAAIREAAQAAIEYQARQHQNAGNHRDHARYITEVWWECHKCGHAYSLDRYPACPIDGHHPCDECSIFNNVIDTSR
ncbi:hypothetical protein H072_6532 [Dactylellina haptotyla CBS 200.50]|uniref:Uncharacterized protein n=1 Tax=Dactylellina haptotyla (strain CBS 200.50) TaxID=1284197 RepID=S8AEY4_DACHA|nr:hypothetical protein H072_6532 [Dactylellina haptotyla CBS 200.50]